MRKILLNAKKMERVIKVLTVALIGVVMMSTSGCLYAMKNAKSSGTSVSEQQMSGPKASSADEALCSHNGDDTTKALEEQEDEGERTNSDLSDDREGAEEPKELSDVARVDASLVDIDSRNIKIVAISDIHGNALYIREKGDVLLIAGDIVNARYEGPMCFEDQYKAFISWTQSLNFEKIVMIAGNHDNWLEQNEEKFRDMIRDTNIIYLKNEYVEVTIRNHTFTVYGTPLCRWHSRGNSAFMLKDDDKERKIYRDTMDGRHIDILLSHDAPFGCSDVCFVRGKGETHVGSLTLSEVVLERKPTFLIHGHLHSSNHEEEILGSTRVYNVSLCDNRYELCYEPCVFEL